MYFKTKITFALFVFVVCSISWNEVSAKPKTNTVQDHERVETELTRTKRQYPYYGGYGQSVANRVVDNLSGGAVGQELFKFAGDLAGQAAANSFKCADRAGCHNGYCWTYCGLLLGTEWCYTTQSYSQSFQYVSCTHDSQCNKCWKCAGSCTV